MPFPCRKWSFLAIAFALALCAWQRCSATVFYVDNRSGVDGFDGTISQPSTGRTGPVKTIGRALELAQTGDTIIIRNTGKPYYESITLFGARHSGYPSAPFTIVGNGAVIDGSLPVPFDAWKQMPDRIWKITPYRKGYYQLLKNDAPLPEVPVAPDAIELPVLADGQWCSWKGSIYYKGLPQEYPPKERFRFSSLGMGMTLYRIHDTEIRDLTFRNFRIDGINSPDLCQSVVLENATSTHNGRSGLFVGGTSTVTANHSNFTENGSHQLLTRFKGQIDLNESETSEPAVKVE